jgi:hypothetical protein
MNANPVMTNVQSPKGASRVGDKSAIKPETNPIKIAVERSSFNIQTIENARKKAKPPRKK